MNRLSRSLLVGLLEQETYITGFYGGGFKPPTKGHFAVVKKSLEQFPDIDKFYVVVGSGIRDGISQDESYSVWNIYKKYLGDKVEIVKADSSPLKYIKDYIKDNTDHKSFIFIGTRDDNDDDAQDFVKRKSFFENYGDHIEVKNIITKGGTSGTKAREAAQISKEQFRQFLPDVLTQEEIDTIYEYVSTQIQELAIKNKTIEFAKNLKSKFKVIIQGLKNEGKETREAFNLLLKAARGEKILTPEEKKQIGDQLKDLLRLSGLAAVSILPGGTVAAILIKVLKKEKWITPSSFRKDKEEITEGDKRGIDQYSRELMKENDFDSFDYSKHIKGLTEFMLDQGLELNPLPSVKFVNDDVENASKHLTGKTAYYDPEHNRIVLYTLNRHPKDVLRSFAHEMIHHMQNCEDRLGGIYTQDIEEDDHLKQIEAEAYEKGNLAFRAWTGTITEGLLAEGKYDRLTNQITSEIFNSWKSSLDPSIDIDEEQSLEHNLSVNEQGLSFDVYANLLLEPGVDGFETLDTTGAGTDKNGDFIEIHLRIDPEMLPQFWGGISMTLKDIVRHEIEHLTHNIGAKSSVKSKELEDDSVIRSLIKAKLLPQGEYWKLPKEVDASIQGMYFRAKKIRKPLKLVLNNYLDLQDITPEEKQEILQLWDKRAKELNLPSVLQENLDPSQITVYLDMDGVLADFDERFRSLAKMEPNTFKNTYGMDRFWDFIDEEHKLKFWVGIPVMYGAKELVDYVSKYHYEILTAPSVKKQSRLGKTLWVKNHADLFDRNPKINFKPAKEKHLVKSNLTPNDILIDDRKETIDNWNAAGGTGIYYRTTQQVISDLNELGL